MRRDVTGHDVPAVAEAITAAATSMEARFVDIAGRLEQSVAMVTTLTTTFATLSDTLKGEHPRHATQALSRVAAQVAALAQARSGALDALTRLAALTAAIGGRVARMAKSVDSIGLLATNAKIAVAHIGDAGRDLASFAEDINRTLRMARSSLDRFAAERAEVDQLARAALATRAALESRREAAARAIPGRLGASVAALAARGKRAAATALAVGEGSSRVGQRLGEAVMALQIGDATRQRIEHVAEALRLLDETLGAPADPGQADSGRAALTGFVCRLQAAQLVDTADTFDREVERILTSLLALAEDADRIPRLGQEMFGASDAPAGGIPAGGIPAGGVRVGGVRAGGFLGELGEDVGAVDGLLAEFRAARREAGDLAAAVSRATLRLAGHIVSVRALESDIRLMGLNMSFKCGRLGFVGRPLAIIAQELRGHAKEIAASAREVNTDLDGVSAIASALSGDADMVSDAALATISENMAEALARLARAGEEVAAALGALDHDGQAVAALLQNAVAQTRRHGEISRALRQAAAGLARVGPDLGPDLAPDLGYDQAAAAPQAGAMLERIAASYTMEGERVIFARHAPALARRPAPPPAQAELADIFF